MRSDKRNDESLEREPDDHDADEERRGAKSRHSHCEEQHEVGDQDQPEEGSDFFEDKCGERYRAHGEHG